MSRDTDLDSLCRRREKYIQRQKWIRKIELLAEDKKGFWEVRGYSNSAEP